MSEPVDDPLRDPALYSNRELSQLDFNFRVLAQAQDPSVPLLERLRFLCISCTNLDEFFEIRAATVRHAQDFGMPAGPDGLPPATVLRRIHDAAAALVQAQYACWNGELRPALNAAGVRILPRDAWTEAQDACIQPRAAGLNWGDVPLNHWPGEAVSERGTRTASAAR